MATGGNFTPENSDELATIGGMIKHGTIVTAYCNMCGASKLANLRKLQEHLGDAGTLIDRHPQCWRKKCDGEVLFHAKPRNRSTPSRPLVTVKGQVARFRRRRDRIDRFKALRNG